MLYIKIIEKICQKCNSEMTPGIIPTYRLGSIPPSFWIEKISFLKGMENKHEIESYRCNACGYLENYAK